MRLSVGYIQPSFYAPKCWIYSTPFFDYKCIYLIWYISAYHADYLYLSTQVGFQTVSWKPKRIISEQRIVNFNVAISFFKNYVGPSCHKSQIKVLEFLEYFWFDWYRDYNSFESLVNLRVLYTASGGIPLDAYTRSTLWCNQIGTVRKWALFMSFNFWTTRLNKFWINNNICWTRIRTSRSF